MNASATSPLTLSLRAATAAGLLLVACAANALGAGGPVRTDRVEVRYADPVAISRLDLDPTGQRGWLDALSGFVAQRAELLVPENRRLLVTITEVRRAGLFEPWRQGPLAMVRIVRAERPARINLIFQLVDSQGAVLKEGSRELVNHAFTLSSTLIRDDELGYEKALIDSWLRDEFGSLRR